MNIKHYEDINFHNTNKQIKNIDTLKLCRYKINENWYGPTFVWDHLLEARIPFCYRTFIKISEN